MPTRLAERVPPMVAVLELEEALNTASRFLDRGDGRWSHQELVGDELQLDVLEAVARRGGAGPGHVPLRARVLADRDGVGDGVRDGLPGDDRRAYGQALLSLWNLHQSLPNRQGPGPL